MNIPVLTPITFWAAVGVVAALTGALGVQTVRLATAQRSEADLKTVAAQEGERQARAVAAAVQVERDEENRRRAAQQKVIDDATAQHEKDVADAAAARTERDRLRAVQAAYLAASRQTRSDSAPAGASAPAADPLDLLSELFSRADDRAGAIGEYADDLRTRLVTCNRSYEALTAGAAVPESPPR